MGADNAACDYDGGDCERVHKLKEMYPKCDTSSIYKDIFAGEILIPYAPLKPCKSAEP